MRSTLFLLVLCRLVLSGQPSAAQQKQTDQAKTQDALRLPFIGTRQFETRHAVSGTGTPHKSVEIKKNGDVYFYFEQENQADGSITKGKYYAGKFGPRMKCVFKEWDSEVIYYEIAPDVIYELDQQNKRRKSEDCCRLSNEGPEDQCPCAGDLYK